MQPSTDRAIGAVFVLLVVTLQAATMGRAIWGLNAGLVMAFFIWAARTPARRDAPSPLLPVFLVGIAVQCLHLCEEYLTGFQRDLPGMFGYQWTDQQFLTFNLLWLAAFVLAALGVYRRSDLALLVVWFFALVGGIGNGILHLALTIAGGRYFPGAATAPFCLVIGILLVRALLRQPEPHTAA